MAFLAPGAGELRHRLRVERDVVSRDAKGNTQKATQTIATGILAKVTDVRGGEEVRGDRLGGISNFDIVVRISSKTRSIQPSDRLVDERDGTIYQVKWKGDLVGTDAWMNIAAQTGGQV